MTSDVITSHRSCSDAGGSARLGSARLGPGTRTRSGEDLDVLLRTVLDGAAVVVYDPTALVRHHHRADYAVLRRMAYDYGVGLSALFVKHVVAHSLAIARRLPAGLALLLAPGSNHNAERRDAEYPTELTVRELLGVTAGPLAFARSRRKVRTTTPSATDPTHGPDTPG